MLSLHYRLLTMTHQWKTENLDWYVMCYLEYTLIKAVTFHKVSPLMSVKVATIVQKAINVIWVPSIVSSLNCYCWVGCRCYLHRDHSVGVYRAYDLILMVAVIVVASFSLLYKTNISNDWANHGIYQSEGPIITENSGLSAF